MERLCRRYPVLPILSKTVQQTPTRFFAEGKIEERVRALTGREPISTIAAAEPIGPQKLCDLLVIAPCTGNTLSKLALGISDTPVTLAAKAHLRNARPVLLAPCTNDALGQSAKNIGLLLNAKHFYFVPFFQDDPIEKPNSLVSRFDLLEDAIAAALEERQIQPLLFFSQRKEE